MAGGLIGALRISLSADSAQFEAGMKRASRTAATQSSAITKSLGTIKAGIAGLVGALSIGMLTGAIKGALDYAGSLGELSQQIGVSTRDLQVLRYAAGQNGVAQEELEKGLSKLTITLGQVAVGAKAPTKALEAIGISVKDVAGLDTGAVFRKIADGLAPITDRAQRAAVEVALFGKTGAKLDTLLSGGSQALNDLAAAAETLGIVLSDEQIQNADATADRLDAIKTVLEAKIAGVVSDNAASILDLANAFAKVGFEALNAIPKIMNFINAAKLGYIRAQLTGIEFADMVLPHALGGETRDANRKAFQNQRKDIRSGIAKANMDAIMGSGLKQGEWAPPRRKSSGASVGQFLASPGGGSKKPKADHGAEKAERARLDGIRNAYRNDEDTRRADMDILRAKQDLSTNYIEQGMLAIDILDLERKGYVAELANDVALKDKTKAQADALLAQYDIADGLKRQAVGISQDEKRQSISNALSDEAYDIQRKAYDDRLAMADTAAERRALELEMLQIEYDHKRMVLQRIIDESKDEEAVKVARLQRDALPAQQASATQSANRANRGPLGDYLAGVPDTAAKMEEALQSVKVNAIDGLVQGLTDAATGAAKLGDVFKNVARQIIADLLRIQIQKMVVGALGNALGGIGGLFGGKGIAPGAAGPMGFASGLATGGAYLPAFATGGGFSILGHKGTDRNIMSLNGLPIARVSHGERVNISNDNVNSGGGGARVTIVPTPYFDAHVDGRAANVAAPMASRAAMVGAASGQQSMMRQQRRSIP